MVSKKVLAVALIGGGILAHSQLGGAEKQRIGGGGKSLLLIPQQLSPQVPKQVLAPAPATTKITKKDTKVDEGGKGYTYEEWQKKVSGLPVSERIAYENITAGAYGLGGVKTTKYKVTKTLGGETKKEKIAEQIVPSTRGVISEAPEKAGFFERITSNISQAIKTPSIIGRWLG